jgi:hypothetical protein
MYEQKYKKYKKKYLDLKQNIEGEMIGWGIEKKINELKLLRRNDNTLKELLEAIDIRKLNFIAAYVINKPSEVLLKAMVYNCVSHAPIHECTYYTHCVLEIIATKKIESLLEINKNCLDLLNRCLMKKPDDFILPVQCSRRNLADEDPHFFLTLIEKKKSIISVSIKDPYFEETKRLDFNFGDKILIDLLKNVTFFKEHDIQVFNSNINKCKMPQAITNDLSCQIWSIIYQYIYLCSSIESNDFKLEQFLNINPFYFIMMFLTNVYHFYKYEHPVANRRKDISIIQPEITYDYSKLNKHMYFNLRRQFLHLIENSSEENCNYYMNIIITNGYNNLTSVIIKHKFKLEDGDKYKNTILELQKYIKKFGKYPGFVTNIRKYINEYIEPNINMLESELEKKQDPMFDMTETLKKELLYFNQKKDILSKLNKLTAHQ